MNKNALEAQSKFNTSVENGLSSQEVKNRLIKYGQNKLKIKKRKNWFLIFIEQFKDPMLILLLIAALVSFIMLAFPSNIGQTNAELAKVEHIVEIVEPIIILLIVLINSIFGAIQEVKAQKAMDSLESMTTPIAKVIRNGEFERVSTYELVPGDIVVLEAGDTVPVDGVIIEANSLKVIESVLTGESEPVEKNDEFVFDEQTAMADKLNVVYSGTNVVNGRAKIIVTNTGMSTEIGKIASLLNNAKDEWSPLEKRMAKVGKILSIFALLCLVFVFLLHILYVNNVANIQSTWVEGFKVSISIAIAVVPEGLLAILTIVLALGMKRMIKYNALIKKTSSVETLGSASVICSDKTGTLTQNKMTVVEVFTNKKTYEKFSSNEPIEIIKYGMLCNDTNLDENDKLIGDPTETSIVQLGMDNKLNLDELNKQFERVEELPFDSDRKLMTTIHKIKKNEYLVITKGAPDNLFAICKNNTELFDKANETMSKKALRVLAIAIKKISSIPKNIDFETIEKDLELVGLFGIIDPPREEVKGAIKMCINAGIRPIMITGDHANTATAIANELGIISNDQKTITGVELSKLSDEELKNTIEDYSVYARVSPEDKIRIVKTWQSKDQIVAMTGDGVNDAPALKAADIGCAMGITGTEVSKDAADMILLDDNFNTIVQAVKEGRGVLDNIKRIMITLFTTNLCELLTLVVGMLLFAFTPFKSIQILWVNLVTESFPGIALGMKKPEQNIMFLDPKASRKILDGKMLFRVFGGGILFASLSLIAFYIGASTFTNFNFVNTYNIFRNYTNLKTNPELAPILFNMQMRGSSLAFIVLAISQSFNAFNTFSSKNICTYKWNEIKYVFYAFCISFTAIAFVLFIPEVNRVFNSDIYSFGSHQFEISISLLKQHGLFLGVNYWYLPLCAIAISFAPTIVFEILKLINNNKKFINFKNKNSFLRKLI